MHHRRVAAAGGAAATIHGSIASPAVSAAAPGDRMNTSTAGSHNSSNIPASSSSSTHPSRMSLGPDGSMTNVGGASGPSAPKQRRRRLRRTTNSPLPMDAVTCLLIVLVLIVSVLILGGIGLVIMLLWTGEIGIGGSRAASGGQGAAAVEGGGEGGLHKEKPQRQEFDELPASPIYTVPHSMSHIGDRSDAYARLRKTFDALLPLEHTADRSLKAQDELRNYPHLETFTEDLPYDIYNCPDAPPPDYPHEWSTIDVLEHWRPEDTKIPNKIHQGLCVFDFRKDYVKALTYRNAELPFVVRGDPEVAAAVERWNTPTYLDQLLGPTVEHRAEISMTNHFMYWVPPGHNKKEQKQKEDNPSHGRNVPEDWTAPTKMIRMTYPEFLKRANVTEDIPHDQMHWYFRLIGCGETGPLGECDAGSSEWLFDELTFFQPRPNLLYLVDPLEQRGIHCRFGMQGVTIANHYDNSRNSIALLGGERRYVLSHPKHCPNLALYKRGHPSARHSEVDWSDPDLEAFPDFAKAQSNEIVMQAGDVLYLPTNWFHYIVSLGLNFQCNTRSGTDRSAMEYVRHC